MFESKTKTNDKFITEEFKTEIAKVSSEDDGSVYIEGVFLKGDIISLNNRFYSEAIVKNFVEQINSNKNIITMWTNHYPTDETLATVAKVIEARYDPETKLAWFKAKMAKTSAAKDTLSLLEDKMLEGVSIRYWPSKVKEAQVKDALYLSILEAEFLGVDFVATRTGVPVAKVKSISREELESFELAFNNKEELDMSDLEKKLTESSDNIDTKEDEKVEDVKEDEKVEDVKEDEKVENAKEDEKVENAKEDEKAEDIKEDEKAETNGSTDVAKEDQEKEEEKVDKKVEDKEEQKPEEINEWKIKYEALVSNINSYIEKFVENLKAEALNTFDSIKDKKIYSKISFDIESIKFDFNEDISSVIDKYNESINSTVDAYKELLDELNTKVAISDAKEAILQKGEVVEGKKLDVGKGINKEAVDLFKDYGIIITEEDAKLMEGN